jgi:hypothetical protein
MMVESNAKARIEAADLLRGKGMPHRVRTDHTAFARVPVYVALSYSITAPVERSAAQRNSGLKSSALSIFYGILEMVGARGIEPLTPTMSR